MQILLLPGNMCDARLWSGLRGLDIRYADLSRDDSIEGMASRMLAEHPRPLLPIGFSMGGIVALEMARQAPDRIKGLILSDTNAGADFPDRAAMRPVQQQRVRGGALAEIISDELKPAYLAAQNRGDEALKSLLFDMAMELGDDVFIRQSEALRTRGDLGPVLDSFAGPILFLCGAEDALCPPALHETMAARCRDAEVHIIDGAGHILPLEQPDKFKAAIDGWLTQQFGE